MQYAFDEAQKAADAGEVPVGAVIVDAKGVILAATHNRVERDHDVSAHAEVLALRQASEKKGTMRLNDCDLYVTLEPCTMCAAAISFARIRRLYFSAFDIKGGAVDHGARFYQSPTCHHAPDVYGGVDEEKGRLLLQSFFQARRI